MRTSGILMPVSSLPSPYGIGSLGAEAYRFVDFLAAAGQRYWQILPIGPTGYGDSPYQSFSAFAANPYFIDLDALEQRGLLTHDEIARFDFGPEAPEGIDYGALFRTRFAVLELAVRRFDAGEDAFRDFCAANAFWLDDYALFMALKAENGMRAFSLWPKDVRARRPAALAAARARLAGQVRFWQVVQYLFYEQWAALKAYANAKGVEFIGDIPIYVSPDSSDLWADPSLFQVDADGALTEVAGCPPDAFAADGQLWGNPLYNWDVHLKTGCAWWIRRLRHASAVYDVVRIDHFRGFESYYAIPARDKTAVNGVWRKGPGTAFIDVIRRKLPDVRIIAEDLGYLTDDVKALLRASGFPGMKVLQFAFDSREESDYLPHNYTQNSVVYTGTHDNTTTADWELSAPAGDVAFARRYLDVEGGADFTRRFIRAALASVSDTAVIPMPDWLGLGAEARINTPSTLGGNWLWRMDPAALTDALAADILALTKLYGRLGALSLCVFLFPNACILFPVLTDNSIMHQKLGGSNYESNRHRAPYRRPWACGHPQGNTPNPAHPRGRPAGDLRLRRGRGDLQEIQPHRGTFGLCRKLCGGALQSVGRVRRHCGPGPRGGCGRSSAGRR